MRLAHFLAQGGVASRRASEKLIFEGRISVNGIIVTNPATSVLESDAIFYQDKKVFLQNKTRLWCYYKPKGLITTHHDEKGRESVFDDITKRYKLPRVMSVGRLDLNSEGLLILSNQGEFCRKAEMSKAPRCYRVRILGHPTAQDIEKIQKGITIDGVHYAPLDIEYSPSERSNQWLFITLYEGKNREIRKLMEYIGCKVNRLIRVSYGPFELGSLKPHEILEVRDSKVIHSFV